MRTELVFTLTGKDRIGLVEEVTGAFLALDGNVETSRMMRLGGEFAMLVLVSVPTERLAELDATASALTEEGYLVTTRPVNEAEGDRTGWLPYRVSVTGADHEGIIHQIAHGLSERGINIESMDTATIQAPVSGTPLFSMSGVALVPPTIAEEDWIGTLIEAGNQANVDIEVVTGV